MKVGVNLAFVAFCNKLRAILHQGWPIVSDSQQLASKGSPANMDLADPSMELCENQGDLIFSQAAIHRGIPSHLVEISFYHNVLCC